MSQRFVIYYTPGPSWEADKPFSQQDLRDHGAYMKQLYDRGQLVSGGPFTDDSGGLAIIHAEDHTQAQAILDADPAIISGVFSGRVHPWFSVQWQDYQP